MGYKRFTETGKGKGGYSCNPKISIDRKGTLGFNAAAHKKFEIDKYKFGVLFYDKDERKVGIKLTNDEEARGAAPIQLRRAGAAISARRFCFAFDILPDAITKYIAKLEGDKIVICLSEGREKKKKGL